MGTVPRSLRRSALALIVVLSAACVAEPVARPTVPDESLLADARSMLEQAREAGAARLAPEPLRQARRRLASAQDTLYRAAAASRGLDDAEQRRVRRLADEAYLDARLALARAQAAAVAQELAGLRQKLAAPAEERRP